MLQELDVLKTVTERLEQARVPYMITGSMAMNLYSTPRMTRDIDVVIELGQSDIKRFVAEFSLDFYIDAEMVREAIKSPGMFNIIHNKSMVKIDFVIRKNEEYRKIEFGRKRQLNIIDFKVWAVSPEDLILSKLSWAKDSFSELQLRDVKNIMDEARPLDLQYIQEWVQKLQLEEIFKKAST